jgi:hypothetical protein
MYYEVEMPEPSVADWEKRLEGHRKRIKKEKEEELQEKINQVPRGMKKRIYRAVKHNTTLDRYTK